MKDEVLRRQGISQEDVSEVCEQLRPDAQHFTQAWWKNWKEKTKWEKAKKTSPDEPFSASSGCITSSTNANIKPSLYFHMDGTQM